MANVHSEALVRHSLNLLKGHMVEQLATGQIMGGLSLNEFMLGRPGLRRQATAARQLPRPAVAPDAATLRQTAADMEKGMQITGLAAECVKLVEERLARMKDITGRMRDNPGDAAALKAEYAALAAAVKDLVEMSELDGMRLLDGESWANDRRIEFGPQSPSGRLISGLEYPGPEITLFDLSGYKNIFTGHDLDDPDATLISLEQYLGQLSGMRTSYEARSCLFASESAALNRQADILEKTLPAPPLRASGS